MARIRTIKPEFWKHEELSALPEATHMLAAALLNYADDFGYFNANPKLVQAECCPLREPSVSVPESLVRLQAIGYIRLGTGEDGRQYGHVVEFEKHQRVAHPTKSKIKDISITWNVCAKPPENIGNAPETFAPEQGTGNKEQGTGNRERATDAAPESDDVDAAIQVWNELANDLGLPVAKKITNARRKHLKARLRDCGGLDGWGAATEKIRAIPWMHDGSARGGWKCNLDFVLQESSFTKLMEGAYDGSGPQFTNGFAQLIAEGGFATPERDDFSGVGEGRAVGGGVLAPA